MYMYKNKNVPMGREFSFSLRFILGLGFFKSNLVMALFGIPYPIFIINISNFYFRIVSLFLEQFVISDAHLRNLLNFNYKFLIESKTYRGMRHLCSLPVRGQRTRTNARTRKNLRSRKSFI